MRKALGLAVLSLFAGAARADGALVVFGDGRILQVASFQLVDADDVRLSFPGGGEMTIPLDLVDRIVDEEYERPALRPEGGAAAPSPRSVRRPEGRAAIASPFSAEILEAAERYRIDPALIAAVIRAESNFVPSAVSRKGARGLMQLMPATARRLGVARHFDPKENILGGTAYLAELAERYGDTSVELILAAYNAGERAVEEYGGVPPYRETLAYVRRVTDFWASARVPKGS
jgi:soluble lytic murein transglycosylase-like protein